MKYITCFLIANIFYFAAFCSFACDPSHPCKSKNTDTTARKAEVKITATPVQIQPSGKPTAKKEEKKNAGEYVSPFSWRPTFLY